MSIKSIPSVASFNTQPYPSFSCHGPMSVGPGSTPTLSLSGSQQVTSSGFYVPKDKSPHLLSINCLSQGQAAEIYHLVSECQKLCTELAKKFQHLSTLKVTHRMAAQATAHETINARCVACKVAGIRNMLNPDGDEHERIQQWLHMEADQAWKDTNDILFSH